MSIYIFSGIFIYLIIGIALFVTQRRMIFNKSGKPKRPAEYGLNEIKEVLQQMDLNLGISVPEWPPENIEELAKQFEDPFNK